MKNKKKLSKVLVAVLVFLMATGCGKPSEEKSSADTSANTGVKVIRLAHNSQQKDDDLIHYQALRFKEIVEKKSNGKFNVKIFPGGQYGGEREIYESLTLGTTDMSFSSNANIGSFVPAAIAVDLPFIYPNNKALDAALDGPAGQAILNAMNSVGVQGLAYGEVGFRHFVTNGKAIRKIGDLAGMKMRVIENKMVVEAYKALGANPVPMAWSESLTGIQQGTIDGLDIPISIMHSFNFQGLAKYASLTGTFYNAGAFCINQNFYKGLTKEQQTMVREAAIEAAKMGREFNREKEKEWLTTLEKAGMKIIRADEIDMNSFHIDAIQKLYNDYAKQIGGTYVQDLLAATKT